MAKFTFRGKDLEDVMKMEMKEFAALLTSRERRSLLRGFKEHQKKLLEHIRRDPKKFHRTKCRDMIIIPEILGVKIGVYSGKEYVPLEIRPDMLGHRLGEFVLTRKKVGHSAPGFGATRSSKYVPLK
jgi:small subunit ribosomal protein S19